MDRALQAILIAGEKGMTKVINGDIKATIRVGERDYTNGPVMIGCHILNWARLFNITEIIHAKLIDLTSREIYVSGYDSYEDMFTNLKKFYPEVTHNTKVTFVRWETIK